MFWLEKYYNKERKTMNYSYAKTLKKGFQVLIFFGAPWLVSMFIQEMPEIANLSIGGLLMMGANWLKHKFGVKLGGLL